MFEKWKDGIIFVNDGNKCTCVFNSDSAFSSKAIGSIYDYQMTEYDD